MSENISNKFSTIDASLNEQIGKRVIHHKERFTRLFFNRIREILPGTISYMNTNADILAVDWYKVEIGLREYGNVVLGKATNGKIMIMGFCKNYNSIDTNFFYTNVLKKEDIQFVIPTVFIPEKMQEITTLDDCESGNFVVLRNKTIAYNNDFEIIEHYTRQLAEIVSTRFSLSMQGKMLTLFKSDIGDESMSELINAWYNGSPYEKTSKLFDAEDNIVHIEASNAIPTLMAQFKIEHQHIISELFAMLGINSLAVEKESGVSDNEANGNNAFTDSNTNVHLKSRNQGLFKLNKRYNLDIRAIGNDKAITTSLIYSELSNGSGGDSNV